MTRNCLLQHAVFTGLFLIVASCSSSGTLVNNNVAISNQNWAYYNIINTTFKVENTATPYNIYFLLRHSADYKYANIFVLLHEKGPDHQQKTIRYEFKLANPDGEWLGNGSGNLYSYRLTLLSNFRFAKRGEYSFSIEQNMRDNPLQHVSDVGLTVEKAR